MSYRYVRRGKPLSSTCIIGFGLIYFLSQSPKDVVVNLECDDPVPLDTKGLNCPMPLLKAKQMLNKLVAGQVLLVESTDAGSVRDFQVFATQSGHVLLNQADEAGVYKHWLKKSDRVT